MNSELLKNLKANPVSIHENSSKENDIWDDALWEFMTRKLVAQYSWGKGSLKTKDDNREEIIDPVSTKAENLKAQLEENPPTPTEVLKERTISEQVEMYICLTILKNIGLLEPHKYKKNVDKERDAIKKIFQINQRKEILTHVLSILNAKIESGSSRIAELIHEELRSCDGEKQDVA